VIRAGFSHQDRTVEVEEIEKILKHQIEYPALIEEQPGEKEKIDLMVNLMKEAI
jgi:hypothetical protein